MLTIQFPGLRQPVSVQSIVWLEGDANYTRVHYQDGGYSLITQPLRWFESRLNFIRVHRSAIVNPAYIQEFKQKRSRAGWVELTDGQVLPVSRSRLAYTATRLGLPI